jgi:hypothetical protein
MSLRDSVWRHAAVLSAYSLLAIAFAWPLPLHLSTHLTGAPTGDTGVYVWNQWVFHRELAERRHLPYFTDAIFSLTDRANLSLHNYTTFQNLLALPLIGPLGVVTTFNVIYLLLTVVTAYAMFLLARQVTGRTAESWLAGVLFAWSPMLVTRGGGHFSLVAAAPLAVFALLLVRSTQRSSRLPHALALGATIWWAASSDAYYGIYCLLFTVIFFGAQTIAIEPRAGSRSVALGRALDVLVIGVGALVLLLLVSRGWRFSLLGITMSVRGLYTPVLVLTALIVVRFAWRHQARLGPIDATQVWGAVRIAAATAVIAAVMLSPRLYAIGVRMASSGLESSKIYWRSSPVGVDLAAFLLPNPNHFLTPDAVRAWLTPRPDAYLENVASITFTAILIMAGAWFAGWKMSRLWASIAVVFGLCALGPFIHIAGVNTYVPGPWALLRYLPMIGLARTPARLTVMLMLAVCVLFASALAWAAARWPQHRRRLLVGVGTLLIVELCPAPRPLYSAAVPTVYRHVAAAPTNTRLLELPFGVRDGTSSAGNFSARSQYFQTMHGKLLIGGYLSRISRRRLRAIRADDMLDALIVLSEDRTLDPERETRLIAKGPAFVDRASIGYVVIDRDRTPDRLRDFARRALRLEHVETDGVFELYRPAP